MARIVDKDTRLIDVDFGPLSVNVYRDQHALLPTATTMGLNGEKQVIRLDETTVYGGSFIQYQEVDLSMMTMNNEVMQPIEVSVQRTTPVPLGEHESGNNFDQIEEYIYIFSRPLNNPRLELPAYTNAFEDMRSLGLDRTQTVFSTSPIGGDDAGIPSHEQTIYAEKRMYNWNENTAASLGNGQLVGGAPLFSIYGMPTLDTVTTWGTLSSITGPSLHCYRVVRSKVQSFKADGTVFQCVNFVGYTTQRWPAVNITFFCKDPNYTEGEYLTRLANAMNTIPEGGHTA